MSADTPPRPQLPPTTGARLAAAIDASRPAVPLAHLPTHPPAPNCSLAHPPAPNCSNALQPAPPRGAPAQNEPTRLPRFGLQEVLREYHALRAAEPTPSAHPDVLEPAPNCSNAHHDARRRKTNPPGSSSISQPPSSPSRPARPLTPDQLRAARLWAAGHAPAAITAALAISRHTFARWKRRPDFQSELRRLVDDTTTSPHFRYNSPEARM